MEWLLSSLLIVLVVTNAAQFWFWSRQNQRLVDKLMSRNYAEYVQSQTFAHGETKTGLSEPVISHEDLKIEDADILRELNRALPT